MRSPLHVAAAFHTNYKNTMLVLLSADTTYQGIHALDVGLRVDVTSSGSPTLIPCLPVSNRTGNRDYEIARNYRSMACCGPWLHRIRWAFRIRVGGDTCPGLGRVMGACAARLLSVPGAHPTRYSSTAVCDRRRAETGSLGERTAQHTVSSRSRPWLCHRELQCTLVLLNGHWSRHWSGSKSQ